MRRPVPVATAAIAVLLVLGAPFLGLRLTQPDDRVLPRGRDGRARSATCSARSSPPRRPAPCRSSSPTRRPGVPTAEIERLRRRAGHAARRVPGRRRHRHLLRRGPRRNLGCEPGQLVLPGRQLAPLRRLQRRRRHLPVGGARRSSRCRRPARTWSHAVRDTDAPFDVQVTGQSAGLVDINDSLFDPLPSPSGSSPPSPRCCCS